jgi:hypothetical protein
MTTATLKATPTPAGDSMTGIRIRRALQQPGAKGKKGLLLWVQAAFPKAMADKALEAAAQHVRGRMVSAARAAASGPQAGNLKGMGRMGALGFVGDPTLMTIGVDTPSVSDSVNSAVINATDSGSADPGWLSSISSALQLGAQAYLSKTQIDASQQIFNTNLQRAQMGLPPIPTNPTAYGLPSPTVNFGLAGGTLTPLLWVAGGIGAIILISSLAGGSRRSSSKR